MMKIATWNINSVRLRLPMVLEFLQTSAPDILCLQETKTVNETFPAQAFRDAGYEHLSFQGMKSYNGVAIISKIAVQEQFQINFVQKEDCRHLAIRFTDGTDDYELHNFYVPAGGDVPDVALNLKFAHKLAFIDEMRAWFLENRNRNSDAQKIILLGDLNIAPLPEDVWSHKQLLNVVSHTAIEVEKLTALQHDFGWIDAARHLYPPRDANGDEVKLYSWWSYRAKDWRVGNRGRRLDHIWVSSALQSALKNVEFEDSWRSKERPSDHIPVILTLK